jgi:hypothetical protein
MYLESSALFAAAWGVLLATPRPGQRPNEDMCARPADARLIPAADSGFDHIERRLPDRRPGRPPALGPDNSKK